MAEPATERFRARASALGFEPAELRTFDEPTRTAQQAADALGCELGQIVKSLIFDAGDELVLVLTSGSNRVDEARAAALLDVSQLDRADPEAARSATGFAIGGIPPFGHTETLRAVVDEDLLTWSQVWAAAGAPESVFALSPAELVAHSAATVGAVAAN